MGFSGRESEDIAADMVAALNVSQGVGGTLANPTDGPLFTNARVLPTGGSDLVRLGDVAAGTTASVVATGSTARRSHANRFGERLTVTDFGATGNGTTDDYAAIQAGINAVAASGGGELFFPDGTYYISQSLTIGITQPGVTLRGTNNEAIITTGAGAYEHLIISGTIPSTFLQHITISNLKFIGSGLGIRTRCTEFLCVERCSWSGTVNGMLMSMNANETDIKPTIKDCLFYGLNYGIRTGDTRVADGQFHNLRFVNNSVRSVDCGYLDGGEWHQIDIFSDLAVGTENDGMNFRNSIYLTLRTVHIFEVNGYGLYLAAPRRSTIEDLHITLTGKTSRKAALTVQTFGTTVCEKNSISNVEIHQPYGHGVDLTSMLSSDIRELRITEAGYTEATNLHDAIKIASCDTLRITDCLVHGTVYSPWSSLTTYAVGDQVWSGNHTYISIQAGNLNHLVTDPVWWTDQGTTGQTRYWLNSSTSTNIDLRGSNIYLRTLQADLFRSGANSFKITWNAAPVSITATYTATFLDTIILANATGGAITVNLPSATACPGKEYVVIKTDASANAVTVDPASTQTINGAATSSLAAQYNKLRIVCDGANWLVV